MNSSSRVYLAKQLYSTLSNRPHGSNSRHGATDSEKLIKNMDQISGFYIRVRRGRIGSGVCFPPQRTKERNLKLPTDLFMIYSSMKNQQMSLVAFFLPKNQLPQGDEFSKESNNRSLKEKSTAKRLTIKQLMELVCIGSQKSVHWVTKSYSIFKSGGLGLL